MEQEKTSGKLSSNLKSFVKDIEEGNSKTIHAVVISLFGLLLVLMIFNVSTVSITGNVVKTKVAEIKEANRPAEITLTIIDADCPDCQDMGELSDYIKGTNVKILGEEVLSVNSNEAREIISKYEIKMLPTVLVSGEVEKTNLKGFSNYGDSLVYDGMTPPYLDVSTMNVRGRVEIINIVDSSCEQCVSLNAVTNAFTQSGVVITDLKNLEYDSVEGKALIEEYGVETIPSMLISKEIDYYDGMKEQIATLNPSEMNGFYKIHSTIPPFRNLSSNEVKGLVRIVYLDDDSCTECYDVNSNKAIIQRLGLFVNSEESMDINSDRGRSLIKDYGVEKVPIILISPEAGDYDFFRQIWVQVGTEEDDGWFVMRNPELIGTYKDLIGGRIINPGG